MPKCKDCYRDTVTGLRADGSPVLLDASPPTYVFPEAPYFEDHGRVVLSAALVVHEAVCPAILRQRDATRQAARARQAKQHQEDTP